MIASNDTFLNLRETIQTLSVKDNNSQNMALERLFLSYKYPGLERREVKDLLLVLWKMDTLGDSSTWSIYRADETHFLRKIKLQNKNPYHLMAPDTFGSERTISNENAFNFIGSLPKSSLALDESKRLVIDGVKCGIISSNMNIDWWYQASQTFTHFDNWFAETLQKFDSMF